MTACIAVPAAHAQSDRDLNVQVQIVGDEVQSTASLFVRASQQRVWDVITDYERAPEFTRDLQLSKVVSRSGDTLRLLQKNKVRVGLFSVPIETVRDVKLQAPVKMDARLVSGSMKKFDSSTELVPENGGTRIVYRSQAVLNPFLAGFATESFVKRETEARLKELRIEIMRREHVASVRP
ncbi:MAG TPA: SRPBCC family protein [Burkholderiales bacterium]|nr:SRPBCC family protein [Burkholderiales bacterium]